MPLQNPNQQNPLNSNLPLEDIFDNTSTPPSPSQTTPIGQTAIENVGALNQPPPVPPATRLSATSARFSLKGRIWKIILRLLIIVVIIGIVGVGLWYGFQFYQSRNFQDNNLSNNGNGSTINNSNLAPTVIINTPVVKDSDGDGLTDEEEQASGTNPTATDTDSDGLPDRAEVRIYFTNPNLPDTDKDGYKDGDEVKNYYDPNGKGKLFDFNQVINK